MKKRPPVRQELLKEADEAGNSTSEPHNNINQIHQFKNQVVSPK